MEVGYVDIEVRLSNFDTCWKFTQDVQGLHLSLSPPKNMSIKANVLHGDFMRVHGHLSMP